jgi:hypothetical protein
MDVSLIDACRLLGKTPRQVRYLVKKGELRAKKVAGRWVVDADELPLSEGQKSARASKEQALRDTGRGGPAPAMRSFRCFEEIVDPLNVWAA